MKTRYILAQASIAGAVALWVAGCATSVIPRDVIQQVPTDTTFKQVLANPDAFKGHQVMWGGQLLSLRNEKEGTYLEVLQAPLDSDGRPSAVEASEGRFLAFFDKYIDEAVFHPGRLVTVIGQVEGRKLQALGKGKVEYAYPAVAGQQIYLWPRPEKPHLAPGYSYPGDWDPWWNSSPWWGTYYYPPVIAVPERPRTEAPRSSDEGKEHRR